VKIKADIVEKDEFEGGIRAYLNFGHTFAHALEKACGFNKMNHGEAVYLGMLAATELSNLTGSTINPAPLKKYRPLYNFRVTKDDLSVSNLMEYMKSDKKRLNENLRFILLDQWQHPVIKTVNNKELIEHSWMAAINELNPIQ
jgi:3-dehydroquinate synthase